MSRWTLAAAVLCLAQVATAQTEGIAVVGRGLVRVRPAQAEILVTVSGDDEIANDALMKYREAKRRALDAIQALGVENLTVREDGPGLANPLSQAALQQFMGGPANAAAVKPTIVAQERLRLVLANTAEVEPQTMLETLVKLIDSLKDSGVVIGGRQPSNWQEYNLLVNRGGMPAAVTFKIDDAAEVRRRAYAMAMEDARSKAARLAELAGVRLGAVLAVEESPTGPGGGRTLTEPTEISSETFEELPVTVTLAVRFAIEEGEANER